MTQQGDDKELKAAFAEFKELLRRDFEIGADPSMSAAPEVRHDPAHPTGSAPSGPIPHVAAPSLHRAADDRFSAGGPPPIFTRPELQDRERAPLSRPERSEPPIAIVRQENPARRQGLLLVSMAIVGVGLGAVGWLLTRPHAPVEAPPVEETRATEPPPATAPETPAPEAATLDAPPAATPEAEKDAAAPAETAPAAPATAKAAPAAPVAVAPETTPAAAIPLAPAITPPLKAGLTPPAPAASAPVASAPAARPAAKASAAAKPAAAPSKPAAAPAAVASPKAEPPKPVAPVAAQTAPAASAPEPAAAAPPPVTHAAPAKPPVKIRARMPTTQSAEHAKPPRPAKPANGGPSTEPPTSSAAAEPTPAEPPPPPPQNEGGAFGFVKRSVNSVGSTISNIGKGAMGLIR